MMGFEHVFTLFGTRTVIEIVGNDGARNVFVHYLSLDLEPMAPNAWS